MVLFIVSSPQLRFSKEDLNHIALGISLFKFLPVTVSPE